MNIDKSRYKYWSGFIGGIFFSLLLFYIITEIPSIANPEAWVAYELRSYLNEISRTQTTIDGVVQYMKQNPPKFVKGEAENPIFEGNKVILRVRFDNGSHLAWHYMEAYTYINNGEEPSYFGNFYEENCTPKR